MNVFCPFKYFVIKLHVLIHVDVMLLDEPWASDDKENKKPSEPSEEDTCLIEDLPVVCNEVRVHTFFIMVVLLIFYQKKGNLPTDNNQTNINIIQF